MTTVPVDGLQLLNLCVSLAGGRGLVLIADEGPLMFDEVCVDREPVPMIAGDVRLPVAFELLQLHVMSRKGFWESASRHEDHRVCLLGYGFQPASLPRTRLSFKQCVESMSPDSIYTLQESLIGEPNPSIQALLLMLRLTQGDQDTMMSMHRWLNQETWGESRKEDVSIQLAQVGMKDRIQI